MTGSRSRRRLSAPLLAACALWAGLAAEAAAQGSAASDRAVLEALYDATGGPDWIDSTNWKTAAPLGEWFGVTTATAGRVTSLELPGNGLAGPIPGVLGELVLLRNLELGSRLDLDSATQQSVENTLTGPIPAELGNLSNLDSLSLDGNALTGPIPAELGRLTGLRWLILGGNALTGPIPAELGNLSNLGTLVLRENALTGPIPAELGNLSNLNWLTLEENALTGPIPAELGNLSNLNWLNLAGNALTGPIPVELGNLPNLGRLFLYGNALTGPIPAELGNLSNLNWLNLAGNELTGPVPSELGNLQTLEWLLLGFNPLTGSLPQSLTRLLQLTTLRIDITGACAPHDAAFQTWLATIDFEGESCNRPPEPVDAIPGQTLTESGPSLALSLELYFTDPDDDALTYAAASGRRGTVTALVSDDTLWLAPGTPGTATVTVTARDPDGLSADQSVAVTTTASAGPQNDREALEVFYDATGGPNWKNATNWKTAAPLSEWHGVTTDDDGRVTWLDLYDNGLTGPLPPALAELANLELLDLSDNDLVGPLPAWLAELANLEWLDLSDNDLVGPLPAWLGNLAGLRWLSLWGNGLTGPIPDSLGGLVKLEGLELGRNDLTGLVPAWLGNLPNLQSLWLSENQLAGPIPSVLRRLANLRTLVLAWNDLTGPIPSWFGDLTELRYLDLAGTALTGPIPDELGNLVNLEGLSFDYAWGVSGPLPAALRQSRLESLNLFATQACTPAAWGDWPQTLEDFEGRSCDSAPDVTIDVAVVYTPAAREALGGAAATEAQIDLLIAETNQAFAESNANVRVALAGRSEVDYVETGSGSRDLDRLRDPSDGYMDEAHALRDRVGADLVSLMVDDSDVCGIAYLAGAFSLTIEGCAFTHELGHNFGLLHDRYEQGGGSMAHPAYGYVNQRGFTAGVLPSNRWITIMAYPTQCNSYFHDCSPWLLRFSNPRQHYNGDPLGIAFGEGGSGATGPADAVAVLSATGPIVADWGDVPRPNLPPSLAGTLPNRTLAPDGTLTVDVSQVFVDPDGDALTYTVSSSAPRVVAARAVGARVTLTAVGEGTVTIRVTATDPRGLSATQSFTVTVSTTVSGSFTDDPLQPGVTPVKAVHFTELRTRIDVLRAGTGLGRFAWTDPVLRAGVTPVRRVHLLELRVALVEAYRASGRTAPRWTDTSPSAGTAPIRAAHVTELRAAVLALE